MGLEKPESLALINRILYLILTVSEMLTDRLDAFSHLVNGKYGLQNNVSSLTSFTKAFEIDSTFAAAALFLAYWNYNFMTSHEISIPVELYHVMQAVGSFVTGTHSLLFRWAEFTSGISDDPGITTSHMISLLKSDFNERDIVQTRDYYSRKLDEDMLHCVWTGKRLGEGMHIDNMTG